VKTLHLAVACAAWDGRRAVAAVMRWRNGGEPQLVVRRLDQEDTAPAGYRALALGLYEARRMGAKIVEVAIDDPEVTAQLDGTDDPPAEVTGPYLEARGLLNAFRRVDFRAMASPLLDRATAAATAAVRPQPRYADLPLWVASRTQAA
jgi:hypothetical protein